MSESTSPDQPPSDGVPGHWVVLGMFAFAIVMTGLLWTYTKLHNAPFIPLRRALAEEYSRSAAPRVEGGRHRNGPMILRVVLNVDFDPTEPAEFVRERVAGIQARIIELARAHVEVQKYEDLQIFLVHLVPEGTPQRLEINLKVKDLPPPPAPR